MSIKATNFYSNMFDRFKTPFPFGKVSVYLTGTDTRANTFKDSYMTETNSNPVICDENGECSIFFSQDITVDYVIESEDGTQSYNFNSIRQLMGENGGEPAPFNPSEEELEKFRGRQGIQGPSTIGDIGEDGVQGDKGVPPINEVILTNNQEHNVPIGVPEVFITASAGGGAAASWSPYYYLYDVKSRNQNFESSNANLLFDIYKLSENDSYHTSKNHGYQENRDFVGITLAPGSGFSGQSVFRYKISFSDVTVSHKVLVYVGSGGVNNGTDLNGGNGGDTKIYVDDKLVLTLKGGEGGQQQLPPAGSTNYPDFGTGGYIRLNKGFKTQSFYCKLTNPDFPNVSYIENTSATTTTFKTKYKRKLGEIFEWKDVWILSFYRQQNIGVQAQYFLPLCDKTFDLKSEQNIFGTYYTQYPSLIERIAGNQKINASIKGVKTKGYGAGAGGDAVFQFNTVMHNPNEQNSRNAFNNLFNYNALTYTFMVYDKEYLRNIQIKMMQEFQTDDNQTYTPGVDPLVDKDDEFFNSLDAFKTNLESIAASNPNYKLYSSPGFYSLDLLNIVQSKDLSVSKGGNGQNGFVKIEYGKITEHTSSEDINKN